MPELHERSIGKRIGSAPDGKPIYLVQGCDERNVGKLIGSAPDGKPIYAVSRSPSPALHNRLIGKYIGSAPNNKPIYAVKLKDCDPGCVFAIAFDVDDPCGTGKLQGASITITLEDESTISGTTNSSGIVMLTGTIPGNVIYTISHPWIQTISSVVVDVECDTLHELAIATEINDSFMCAPPSCGCEDGEPVPSVYYIINKFGTIPFAWDATKSVYFGYQFVPDSQLRVYDNDGLPFGCGSIPGDRGTCAIHQPGPALSCVMDDAVPGGWITVYFMDPALDPCTVSFIAGVCTHSHSSDPAGYKEYSPSNSFDYMGTIHTFDAEKLYSAYVNFGFIDGIPGNPNILVTNVGEIIDCGQTPSVNYFTGQPDPPEPGDEIIGLPFDWDDIFTIQA